MKKSERAGSEPNGDGRTTEATTQIVRSRAAQAVGAKASGAVQMRSRGQGTALRSHLRR